MPESTKSASDILPNECWMNVFVYLSLRVQISCQSVCKKWKSLTPVIPSMRHLNIAEIPSKKVCLAQTSAVNEFIYRSIQYILPAVGIKLTSISFYSPGKRCCFTADCARLINEFCPNLQILTIGEIEFGAQVCFELQKMSNLRSLTIENRQLRYNNRLQSFCDQLSVSINNLGQLQHLKLYFASRLGQIVAPNLTELIIPYSNLTNCQLAQICQTSNKLEVVVLSESRKLSDFTPITKLKFIRSLSLSVTNTEDSDLRKICLECTTIETLELSMCIRITDFSYIPCLQQLKHLNMSCTGIDNNELVLISNGCRDLQSLNICFCKSISSFNCLKMLKKLRNLNVANSEFFDDISLIGIANNCNLEVLQTDSPLVTDSSLIRLAQMCPKLQLLDIEGTAVSPMGIAQIIGILPSISVLSI